MSVSVNRRHSMSSRSEASPIAKCEPVAKESICLISVCDQAYAEVADANKQAYCDKHGYTYRSFRASLDVSRHIAWSKVVAVLRLLPDFSWVMWTDADSLVMDMERSLERWTATDRAIVICQESNDNFTLNTGQFLVRNCEASIKVMQAWLDKCPANSSTLKTLIDQPHFMKVYEEHAWARDAVDICDQREFNSFWHQYCDGDFILHFAGMRPHWGCSDSRTLVMQYCSGAAVDESAVLELLRAMFPGAFVADARVGYKHAVIGLEATATFATDETDFHTFVFSEQVRVASAWRPEDRVIWLPIPEADASTSGATPSVNFFGAWVKLQGLKQLPKATRVALNLRTHEIVWTSVYKGAVAEGA